METDIAGSPHLSCERRRHPRFLIKLPVEYRRANDSIMRPSHTENFSEEGLMVSVSEQMDIGEKLEMKIYFTLPSGLITIAAIVKIAWVDTEARDDGYRVGVGFVAISPVDMEELKGFLNLYGDPHQAPPELRPPAGCLLIPGKLCATKHLGQAPVANPSKLTLFERFLGLGMRVIGKGKSLISQ